MGFTEVLNALNNQKLFRNAFACLFPECQLKACVCGWHLGACWSWGGALCLLVTAWCHCCGTVTSPATTNLCLPLAACETAALHVRQCRKNQQSFSKPAHEHPSHPGGPAEESRSRSGKQRVQGILGKIWGMFWACLFCWQTRMCPLSFPLLF